MASPATENSSRGGSSRGSSRGGRGGPGGRGRGGRGRGRGGARTPSMSSSVDLSSPTTPTNTDSASTKPAGDKPPSLLSRIDMGNTGQSPRSPKANSPSSPRSAVNSLSPAGDGPPTRGGGGGPRGGRRRKNSAASNGPRSPKVTNVPSPLSRRPPVANSPLTSTTSSPKATPPHLLNVVDTASPKNSPSQLSKELEPSQLLEIKSSSMHPSPAPSPRPFTPMARDWAADDEDEDGGSLPSLDDWGLPGVKAASEAGDVKPQDQPSITEPMAKLSLKTDVKKTRGKRSGSAPQSASDSPASASANVIPPTPVATRPGQTQATGNTALKPSPLNPVTLGVPGLPARPMSRTSSPAPLNLANDTRRSPSPAMPPGAHSPGPSPGLRPTSGGVALGVRSRPVSPAPDMGQFYPQASSSPRLGGNFNLAPSPNLTSNRFNHSRPTSPSFNQDASQPGSRQGSPKGRPRALSGGVSLGLAASDSANLPPGSPGLPDRPRDLAASAWRQAPASQPTPPVLLASPIPPTGPFVLPPKPEGQPPQTRANNPNWRGRGSGPRGGRGGRGGHRGGGDNGRFDRYSSQNQPGSPYNPTSPDNQAEYNNRPISHGDSPGPGSRANGPDSPRSVTSNSSAGRGRGGHARTHSRPIIVASALSQINATLSPQRTTKPSTTTSDSVPVTGA